MEEMLSRFWGDLMGRVGGPMTFRLILQPIMAAFFAVRGGLKDAREGRPAYFWAIFTDPAQRREMLRDGWKSVGRVFIFAIVMDGIYQFIVLRWFYPLEALIVAIVLAITVWALVLGSCHSG